MTKTYNEILQFIVDKYKGVFTSLYTINDDTLNDHLLFYLFDYNYIVIMDEGGRPEIFLGESSRSDGVDRYGYVRRGYARVPDMRYSQKLNIFNENNSVVIYSNRDKHSMSYRLWEALSEMASILYIEQNNLRLSNVLAIIEASPTTADTMKNMFEAMFLESRSVIVVKDKDKLTKELNKIDLDVKYLASEYQRSFLFYHNQVLEILGVNFTPHEKQERLITDEVNSNNELTQNISDRFLRRMKTYFTRINTLFGTDYTIERNQVEKIEDQDPDDQDPENKEDQDQ